MATLMTDLDGIARLAETRAAENEDFKDYLCTGDTEEVDAWVQELNAAISPQIDCTACGNCCRVALVRVAPEERSIFARHFNLTEAEAAERYLSEGLSGDTLMNISPCVFLCGNRCGVYEDRFAVCRDFPYLHQPAFTKRLFNVLSHYGSCPIIYNVIEALKLRSGFIRGT